MNLTPIYIPSSRKGAALSGTSQSFRDVLSRHPGKAQPYPGSTSTLPADPP